MPRHRPFFLQPVPVLPSLNIARTVEFYTTVLGFRLFYQAEASYAIVRRDNMELHFWACDDIYLPENSGCRIHVLRIEQLFEKYDAKGIVHPNAPLTTKPWRAKEFGIVDPDGNLITFFEWEGRQDR